MLEGKEFESDIYEPVTSNLLTYGYILSLVFIHYVTYSQKKF